MSQTVFLHHRLPAIAAICLAVAWTTTSAKADSRSESPRGIYFAKKEYTPHPLPTFDKTRGEGRYRLDAAPGEYLVQIRMASRLRGAPAPTGEGSQVDLLEVDWLIPAKYGHFQSSGLVVVVEADKDNTHNLPLK